MLLIVNLLLAICIFEKVLCGEPWAWKYPRVSSETSGVFVGTAPSCSATSNSCDRNGPHPYFWYLVTSGDGKYCSTGRKAYCNSYESPYSSYRWSGTASYCNGECSDCNNGEVCVAEDGSGDGSDCSCSWGCTNKKAMCVRYRSGRRLINGEEEEEEDQEDQEYIIDNNSYYHRKGVEMGFYLYLGDTFNDKLLLRKNSPLLDDFISAVASALNKLVPNVETTANLGHVLDFDYISGSSQYDKMYKPKFKNAKLIPFINIEFDYSTEIDIENIELYIKNEENKEMFTQNIEMALSKTIFADVDYDVQLFFVEGNCV